MTIRIFGLMGLGALALAAGGQPLPAVPAARQDTAPGQRLFGPKRALRRAPSFAGD